MRYFETRVELSVAKYVCGHPLAWGKYRGAKRGSRITEAHWFGGLVVGGSPVGGGRRLPLCGYHRSL